MRMQETLKKFKNKQKITSILMIIQRKQLSLMLYGALMLVQEVNLMNYLDK